MEPWFDYEIEVYDAYDPEEMIERHVVPGSGNDFPQELFDRLFRKWGGVGYEFRIRTKLRRDVHRRLFPERHRELFPEDDR